MATTSFTHTIKNSHTPGRAPTTTLVLLPSMFAASHLWSSGRFMCHGGVIGLPLHTLGGVPPLHTWKAGLCSSTSTPALNFTH